jgi:diguanylate cyclase (GGDEF)-like protein
MALMFQKYKVVVLVLIGLMVVGYIDFISGIEIRAFPLYFIPLIYAAWHLGLRATIAFSVLATCIWVLAQLMSGRTYSHSYIWLINFFTQGSSFLLVSLLVSRLRKGLINERELSRTDALTGLPNRFYFMNQGSILLAFCTRKKMPVALAFIDLDNFKQVNDGFGHHEGDRILIKVAEMLAAKFRSSDLLARMGGDEFVIFLPDTNKDVASSTLEIIRAQLNQTPELMAHSVTASIGLISYDVAPKDLKDMIKLADQLMYVAKSEGKNCVYTQHITET